MLNLLLKSGERKEQGRALERQIIARARDAHFFAGLGVPDTMDGRFDLVVLHAWLVLVRLQTAGETQAAQALIDALFIGFDEALREQGVSDMGMGRRMKAMANAFYGRLSAYGAAKTSEELAEALARNVWRGAAVNDDTRALAVYVQSAGAALAASAPETPDFGPLP
jgi:cytochrome b pre-mRNA-processing protein 3